MLSPSQSLAPTEALQQQGTIERAVVRTWWTLCCILTWLLLQAAGTHSSANPVKYPNVAVVAGWKLASATFVADILETGLTTAQFEQEMCALATAISSDRIHSFEVEARQIILFERFITPSDALLIARVTKRTDNTRSFLHSMKSQRLQKDQKRVKMDRSARESAIWQALMRAFKVVDLAVQSDKYRALVEEADDQISILRSGMELEDREDVEHIYKFMSDYEPPAPEVVNRKSLDLLNKKRAAAGKPPLRARDASFIAATDEFEQEMKLGHFKDWVTAKVPSGVICDYISWKIGTSGKQETSGS